MLKCLDQVWLDRIFQKCGHSTCCLKIICCNRFSLEIVSNNDSSKSAFKISKIICKTENRHDLRCHCNDKMIFTDHTVCFASKSDNNISENTIIHIDTTFPYNLSWINTKCISLLDMIIEHCCKKVVC